MKKKSTRILAMLLTFVMLVSASCVTAFAKLADITTPYQDENGKYYFTYEQSGTYIMNLVEELLATVNQGKDLYLDIKVSSYTLTLQTYDKALQSVYDFRKSGLINAAVSLGVGGDLSDLAKQVGGKTLSDDEFNKEMADATQDGYPGREYKLHFSAGEDVKYLKVTPLYSELAEGDAQLMLMLKDPSDNFGIGEDTNPVAITIFDEDEPEPVTVSMESDIVTAEGGIVKKREWGMKKFGSSASCRNFA